MTTPLQPFYGCLCLETYGKSPLPPTDQRQVMGISLPEVHFNIWEKEIDTGAFLDIGVMLSVKDPAERIEIFLPWEITATNIEDLSVRILGCDGVSAIFNEAWTSSLELIALVNAIEKFISRLRSKLEPAGITIRTVRGLGYYLGKPEAHGGND